MKTNFAYIDDVLDRKVRDEFAAPTIPQLARDTAHKNSKKLIGGFRVHDEVAEFAALDALIAKQKEVLVKFRKDRQDIRTNLQAKGITPLAVIPSGAWYTICKQAGLFILSPNSQNKVHFQKIDKQKWNEKLLGKLAPKAFLSVLFPEGLSLGSGPQATLILPDPPTDVAEILVKAQALPLTVAAVPEAIRFAETTTEMIAASSHPKDLWAQEQGYADYADWVKRDPIIFTNHGSATAVIAQFGEFPIEQQIVDAAVASDGLLVDQPKSITAGVEIAEYGNLDQMYQNAIARTQRLVSVREMQQLYGGQQAIPPQVFDSSGWTGR